MEYGRYWKFARIMPPVLPNVRVQQAPEAVCWNEGLGIRLLLRLSINAVVLPGSPAITSMYSIEKGADDLRG